MFTNVSIRIKNTDDISVRFDPPVRKIRKIIPIGFHNFIPIGGPRQEGQIYYNLSFFCSIIDEKNNYKEPKESKKENKISIQKPSKFLFSPLEVIAISSIYEKEVLTKTDEYVDGFELWIRRSSGEEFQSKEIEKIDFIICLKLFH